MRVRFTNLHLGALVSFRYSIVRKDGTMSPVVYRRGYVDEVMNARRPSSEQTVQIKFVRDAERQGSEYKRFFASKMVDVAFLS